MQTYIKTKDGIELFCPPPFCDMNWDDINSLGNGCGQRGWKGKLVPDRMYGLDISEACQLHDCMYLVGKIIEDKNEADRVFLNNLIRIIMVRTSKNWIVQNTLLRLRLRRATVYYYAVKHFGGPSFWDGK